ncbi:replication factor-A protein 1 [Theileria orientalis strain Shintoku]|uniref:Replication protein A subunit n=1 Tax=Theileria orientalis strain Shintoku TaxID=869250 RepID=J4DNZ3_THEOR|nr:replication factor-A protein 1 [Theileria orientalis strain Shintoku]BAM39809.1 replication factor-A protein 1 [Theileria orientalis strain Shintoku]|eukprot:XP_009690110.1 replication factor-A protein 1 [Theileria orientalis strain Shintoku]
MSLPRILSKDFFTQLAEAVTTANEKYFQEVHECQVPVKLLCLEQSCIADNKYLIETIDGTVPYAYKHTCLALVPPSPDGDRQLIGKIISFNQYKIARTRSRYLVVLTRISVVPGDYRHLIGNLIPTLVYHPGLGIEQDESYKSPKKEENTKESGPVRKQENVRSVKTISNPYEPPKNVKKKLEIPPTKISDLTLYTPKWLIRARVAYKSDIRKFNNQRGESQLFSVDLCDSNGEIRATFFGESVNKWYTFLEEGQVYSISGGQLKPANKKFNSLRHSCELVLDEHCHIQLFQNDDTIPSFCFSFTPLDQIQNLKVGEQIDVIGVVVTAKDLQTVQVKSTGKALEKRDFLICDSTKSSIWLTSWGPKIRNFNYEGPDSHPLVCLKGVKVIEWQGKKLDVMGSTQVIFEPVIQEALELRKWWNENSHTLNFGTETSRGSSSKVFNQMSSLAEIISATNQALQFKSIDSNGMIFTTRALIEVLKDGTFSWPSCPGCRKRMNNDDGWYCPRCENRGTPTHMYMLTLKIVDETSHMWVTAMTDVGEDVQSIMGTKAYNLVKLMENGGTDETGKNFANYFEEVRLTEYVFKIKATVENFMDEPRLKYVRTNINRNRLSSNYSIAVTLALVETAILKILKAIPLEKEVEFAITDRVERIKKIMTEE